MNIFRSAAKENWPIRLGSQRPRVAELLQETGSYRSSSVGRPWESNEEVAMIKFKIDVEVDMIAILTAALMLAN